jgi:muramoyltetrapeptide carboxypeptidase
MPMEHAPVRRSSTAVRRPICLQAGDTVRIVCPGWPALTLMPAARQARAESVLADLGLKVTYGKHSGASSGHSAGTAWQRAADINDAFADPAVKGIMCAVGGTHSLDLLPLLDYQLIEANPKVFISHSNNASLNLAMYAKARLISFQPLCFANHLGEFPRPFPETIRNFQNACMRSAPICFESVDRRTDQPLPFWFDPTRDEDVRSLTINGGWRWLREGRASGPLVGGYLSPLFEVTGTEWEPCVSGAILYWDATHFNGNVVAVDAILSALARRGILSQIAGMVVGHPSRLIASEWMASLDAVVLKWAAEFDGPILVDADCGHTDPTWVLPLGSVGHLNSATDVFWAEPGTVDAPDRRPSSVPTVSYR